MKIRQATLNDLDALVPLFDAYRQFYGRTADLTLAREFLAKRMIGQQSIIFIAFDSEQSAVGFTQLFPSFSSVSAAPVFILNDLFVAPNARNGGLGASLLRFAADYGRSLSAVRLQLSTATSNTAAQSLYEREGWERESTFQVYQLPLETKKNAESRSRE